MINEIQMLKRCSKQHHTNGRHLETMEIEMVVGLGIKANFEQYLGRIGPLVLRNRIIDRQNILYNIRNRRLYITTLLHIS